MSYSPGIGVDATIGLNVGYKEPVGLSVRRADEVADLTIGHEIATITLDKVHLETLRDQLPGVLADLGVLEFADDRASEAGSRAFDMAAYLNDQADVAEQVGEQYRAGELRGMAEKLTAATKGLEDALDAVQQAAHAADDAAERAQRLLDECVAEERAARPEPTEEQRTNGHPVDAA